MAGCWLLTVSWLCTAEYLISGILPTLGTMMTCTDCTARLLNFTDTFQRNSVVYFGKTMRAVATIRPQEIRIVTKELGAKRVSGSCVASKKAASAFSKVAHFNIIILRPEWH